MATKKTPTKKLGSVPVSVARESEALRVGRKVLPAAPSNLKPKKR